MLQSAGPLRRWITPCWSFLPIDSPGSDILAFVSRFYIPHPVPVITLTYVLCCGEN